MSHPHLTTQESLYVEISRARYRAELVTDDKKALGEHLETALGDSARTASESYAPGLPEGRGPKEAELDLGL